MTTPVVDVHAHALILPAHELAIGAPGQAEAQAAEAATFGPQAMDVNRRQIGRILPLLTDLDARLAAMDASGVDVQLVSPSPQHYHEWADVPTAAKLTRTVNEGIAELCARRPDRLVGLGVVGLHHPELAVRELEYAVRVLGLQGVEISTSAGGRELSHPDLEGFWARAEELQALVFIHPWGCTLGHRLDQHYLANTVGQPVETTLALSHLIFSGLFDRRPRLRVLAAHGGGYLPYYIGRSDHAYEVNSAHQQDKAKRKPSAYVKRFHYDTVIFDPDMLPYLVKKAGASQVMMGSDWPLVRTDAVGYVRRAKGISEADKQRIMWKNSAEFLKIPL
jgi:aminocarboxymuconate-semialdehyde decarboxylase